MFSYGFNCFESKKYFQTNHKHSFYQYFSIENVHRWPFPNMPQTKNQCLHVKPFPSRTRMMTRKKKKMTLKQMNRRKKKSRMKMETKPTNQMKQTMKIKMNRQKIKVKEMKTTQRKIKMTKRRTMRARKRLKGRKMIQI